MVQEHTDNFTEVPPLSNTTYVSFWKIKLICVGANEQKCEHYDFLGLRFLGFTDE